MEVLLEQKTTKRHSRYLLQDAKWLAGVFSVFVEFTSIALGYCLLLELRLPNSRPQFKSHQWTPGDIYSIFCSIKSGCFLKRTCVDQS